MTTIVTERTRHTIRALTHIFDGLDPWTYSLASLEEEEEVRASEPREPTVYEKALKEARHSLLWRLAWAGALDGAWTYDECGKPYQMIVRLVHSCLDPMLITVDGDDIRGGELLADFCERLIEDYVGLKGTQLYGGDAIVELARDWLDRTEPKAA